MKSFIAAFLVVCLCSCGSVPVSFLCNEQHVEIYVDDEYVGRGLVHCVLPRGQEYVTVSCRNDGIELYSRKLYVKGLKNQLFELQIPKDYRYSSWQENGK